ncbi:sugar ABC transporter permease [Paenibacillus thermoaerophilus]|uniref:Sugar ABC transporter permease n=1 Tax=Paenibacillus thermoaerophilus TaxID=1215385 RepID=A0ABW2V5X4_9BACL|nr:sugar ABC transporter permease [Paenibacillus thermoaerophilus]TMV17669.1 sugar ABC transporter permease [Paenibacillus thermoaerophilus]
MTHRVSFARKLFTYIALLVLAVCSIYPALWITMSAFRPGTSLLANSLFPKDFTLDHFRELFTTPNFPYGLWYWNTLKIAFMSMILGTTVSTLTGYALSRFRFKARKTILTTFLVLGMFPGFMSMIAVYIFLLQFDLLDTHAAIIIVYTFGAAMSCFIPKGFFDAIPRSLEEAARIDGASHWKVFTHIMLPLARPMLTYMAMTIFTGAWVDYIFARLVLRSKENWTLAVGMWDMVANFQSSNFTLFAAGAILIALPITLLFIGLQRLLVEGLTSGANKG